MNNFCFAKEYKIPLLDHCFDLVQVQTRVSMVGKTQTMWNIASYIFVQQNQL